KYLATLYSSTGRPALNQIEIFRSMVLCAYLDISWERLIHFLHHRAVFRTIIGVSKDTIPTLPSFYAFSSRIMPTHEKSITRKPLGKKPTQKLNKNEKIAEKKEGRVQDKIGRASCREREGKQEGKVSTHIKKRATHKQ